MKLKLKKLTIESMGISILLATLVTFLVGVLWVCGPGLLWGVLVAVMYPVAEAARKFYKENKCYHMTDFFEKLAKQTIEEEEANTISNIDPYW